jgi:hypothetical protein
MIAVAWNKNEFSDIEALSNWIKFYIGYYTTEILEWIKE